MDALDVKLLNLLQSDARLTVEELAKRVPLSPSAISRRLKQLWKSNVIAGQVLLVSARLRDKRLTAVVEIQLERHDPTQWDKLRRFLADAPEVQLCLEVTGSADVLLLVSTSGMEHFNIFSDHIAAHPLVRRYESTFIKRHVKASLAVCLEEL